MKKNLIVSLSSFILTISVCFWLIKPLVSANQHSETVHSIDTISQPNSNASQVIIRKTNGAPRVLTDEIDVNGKPVTVSCSTCHQTRQPNFDNSTGDDLDEFHQGLTMQHGDLSCLSCHHQDNYDTLRLSDGREIQYDNVMKLCAQCHGTQFRDYENGAHGGMTGYWSLEKGNRTRNNCLHCHDPHYPKYQLMFPVHPPQDRFLYQKETHE